MLRLKQISDDDGFAKRKSELNDAFQKADIFFESELWADAASRFAECSRQVENLEKLDSERTTAVEMRGKAVAAQSSAENAQAGEYAAAEWENAVRLLSDGEAAYGRMDFAAAIAAFGDSAAGFSKSEHKAIEERKAREEAERKAREEAKRKAREEAERKAREEAKRKAREEAMKRRVQEESERKDGIGKVLALASLIGLAVIAGLWLMNEPAGTSGTNVTETTKVPDVSSIPDVLSPAFAPRTNEPRTKTLTLPGGATMEMIYVAPGSFMMGSPESEDGGSNDETLHRVALTKGYWLGKYEVTQRQWESVMGENPSYFKGADRPVDNVSWKDCQRFIAKVDAEARRQFGGGARLPTEAEWEYACRAGTTGRYGGNGNLDDMGWYDGNSRSETHPVGQKRTNAWGFYDMHGNVCEWCSDWYGSYDGDASDPTGAASGGDRVLRGGGWLDYARYCRSAYRDGHDPGRRIGYYGFRLCCSAGPRGGAEQ